MTIKKRWSEDEMQLLNTLVLQYPMWHVCWSEVSSHFPGRTKRQCIS